MATADTATVRMIATLYTIRQERGLPAFVELSLPSSGRSAEEIARDLELPVERIDGVFLNHRGAGLDAIVYPGDRLAFVPVGTPASHPAFFGTFETRDVGRPHS